MKRRLFLVGAVAAEVSGSLSLKAAVEHPAWYVLTAVGYALAAVMLVRTLRAGMPLGSAYGIWGASGVALTATFSLLLFGEPITLVMGLGLVLVIAGVLCMELGAQAAERRTAAKEATG